MPYDINEGNFLTINNDDDEIITPSDPDSDIPDNTGEAGFSYNNYGLTDYTTSEDEPDSEGDESEEDYSGDDLGNDNSGDDLGDNSENDYSDDDYSDDDCSDDSEEYDDTFIEL